MYLASTIPTVPDGYRLLDSGEDLQADDLVHDLDKGSWTPALPDTVRDERAAIRCMSSLYSNRSRKPVE